MPSSLQRLFEGELLLGDSPVHFSFSMTDISKLKDIEQLETKSYNIQPSFFYCYLDSLPDPVDLAHGPAEYFAMLGHLTVKTAGQSSHFPPSSSWRVEGEYIEWTSGSQGSKNLSMKISWGLLERIFLQYPKYNVYVEKLAEETFQNRHGRREGAGKYLGVAHVQAFYVSNLTVPSGIASLKFIIQPCDNDGLIQKLDDSPFFQLDV
ncbi:hypothetical protein Pint_06577 [Pistacia integerrima]|uniref:Uncharacterized protein n=1 Tax=Pistacia integerrima TaxID=434235 RepID=A0ACC0Z7M4_9ROSI|nr:hypothetical protein Pint_06577 [Pistacia integerrima]